MSKLLIEDNFEDNFYASEWAETVTVPATDDDLLILTQKLSNQFVPTQVFFQAVAIAAYDGASAFRYADNYLTSAKHKNRRKNPLLFRKPLTNFDYN
ncbi:hypothetical protein ACN23B_02295 [Anabaena sp. FACHB-709]|uniref:Uncharacterized protein n=2 Tax=Nostocaceae TaxID=1162 RepID=A0A1Z4KR52_ANAVA|nr:MULTISPECIES: hypothetical protein [Nostocaceae]BAY71428.1 hypothetical protein NIES23_42460 [Trichormus variabilis NIES-23]HBW32555.1 hypothetical protein [Nostoc sp. UBA8866]MBD2172111.1 hypothetical protein [Anabaena cylindrica FACHB-318]MBD2263699.1 hypothetical protein [Anabaena sp. FACHB-709]MBD2274715.1 hypothetical protein [Nostoc sp. PCC 7120 = FACHB-418]